ncbi:toxin-antitoxin system HicB family antitoxin [Tunturibacter empetritectus]|uniref:Toxin-antitoxin system HicB family antitoxin n=1 Tax=Tunturiibacter empetritectus TaxID=3069691 RepID=A0AAU7ZDW0_9BACT
MTQEYKRHQSFPLRLSPSIRQQANDLAHVEGISLNHFISLAIAEKIVRMEQTTLLKEQVTPKKVVTLRTDFRSDKLA